MEKYKFVSAWSVSGGIALAILYFLPYILPRTAQLASKATVPKTVIIIAGFTYYGAVLFNNLEMSYEDITIGLGKRLVKREPQSEVSRCHVCNETSDVEEHEVTEIVVNGKAIYEKSRKITNYCDEHYKEPEDMKGVESRFDIIQDET